MADRFYRLDSKKKMARLMVFLGRLTRGLIFGAIWYFGQYAQAGGIFGFDNGLWFEPLAPFPFSAAFSKVKKKRSLVEKSHDSAFHLSPALLLSADLGPQSRGGPHPQVRRGAGRTASPRPLPHLIFPLSNGEER